MNLSHVAEAVLYMANLPLDVNVHDQNGHAGRLSGGADARNYCVRLHFFFGYIL